MEVFNFPFLGNLKHLELIVFARKDQSLLRFTSIIEACPLLHKFVLKVHFSNLMLTTFRISIIYIVSFTFIEE